MGAPESDKSSILNNLWENTCHELSPESVPQGTAGDDTRPRFFLVSEVGNRPISIY